MTEPSLPLPLAVPSVARQQYKRNFIKSAVCELRFPTLHEIDGPKPPLAFAQALRKEYPVHQGIRSMEISGGSVSTSPKHAFTSKNAQWTVSLTPSSVALETQQYESFDDFEVRIRGLVDACQSFIDSDFFTRIGVRYINLLKYEREKIAEAINPTLVQNLASGVFGDATEHAQQIRGRTDVGGFYFQHGLALENGQYAYMLDFDFYADNVDVGDALNVVKKLHAVEYDMFMWSLGPGAKKARLAAFKPLIR